MKLTQSTFLLRISLGNDAFGADENSPDASAEIARILRECADKVERQTPRDMCRFQNLRDANGNTVGQYAVKPEGYEG